MGRGEWLPYPFNVPNVLIIIFALIIISKSYFLIVWSHELGYFKRVVTFVFKKTTLQLYKDQALIFIRIWDAAGSIVVNSKILGHYNSGSV